MKNLKFLFFLVFFSFFLNSCDLFNDAAQDLATENAVDKSGEITNDEVWIESGSSIDIHVTSDLIISAAVEVDKGISIFVEDGAGIIIRDGGSFSVNGRSGDEVKIFGTGSDDEPTWRGIFFNSTTNDNRLSYTEIKGAGSDVIEIGDKRNDAAAVEVLGSLSMSNCLITSSTEVGVLVNANDFIISDLRSFNDIEISGCSTYPVMAEFNTLNTFSENLATCTLSGNGNDMIGLFGDSAGINGNHVWSSASIPYYISKGLNISGGLEIKGGSKLVMQKNAEIYLNSASSSYFLNINGSSSNPISIRGEESGINAWPGIWINSNNSNNRINYTTLIGAGVPSGTSEKSAIFVSGLSSPGSTLSINSLEIQDSECGIRKGAWADISGISTVTGPAGLSILCD